jgi:hypothetical protein
VSEHKVIGYRVECSCGMTVQSTAKNQSIPADAFTLWLTRFLCQHEALSSGDVVALPKFFAEPGDKP